MIATESCSLSSRLFLCSCVFLLAEAYTTFRLWGTVSPKMSTFPSTFRKIRSQIPETQTKERSSRCSAGVLNMRRICTPTRPHLLHSKGRFGWRAAHFRQSKTLSLSKTTPRCSEVGHLPRWIQMPSWAIRRGHEYCTKRCLRGRYTLHVCAVPVYEDRTHILGMKRRSEMTSRESKRGVFENLFMSSQIEDVLFGKKPPLVYA